MYARSLTFNGRPENINAGIAFVKNEAEPLLDSIEGCRGLSMLVDRGTGRCIVTSSWNNERSMLESNDQLRTIRDRGKDVLGGSMQIDEWEFAVMRRSNHGECCRVSWLQGDVDLMIESLRTEILPALEKTIGFCCASLLVNRDAGIGCVTTAWETRGAMVASREASASQVQIVDVHEFDLAYAHLHVPEMA